jgi:sterol desaturase/sphingolipid hydroxylase (fatty acid hydroxylase superfamily)
LADRPFEATVAAVLKNFVAVLAYPLLVIGAAVATWVMGTRGIRPELAVAIAIVAVNFILNGLERWMPWAPRWNVPQGDSVTDVLHLVFSTLAVYTLFQLAAGTLVPHDWPLAAQVAIAIVIAELGAWVVHWLMHTTGPLWRLHLVHHSARRLYAGNSSRNHPLDTAVVLLAAATPLVLLGADARVLSVVGAFAIAHLSVQHANADLKLGPLNWVMAGPELHRWHHSRVPEEANRNYGHVLILWDVIFRTRLLPKDRKPPLDVGLFSREGIDEGYLSQLGSPFDPELYAREPR